MAKVNTKNKKQRDYSVVSFIVGELDNIQIALDNINNEKYTVSLFVDNPDGTDGTCIVIDKIRGLSVLKDIQVDLEDQLKENHGIVVQ
jgi:hypothetical protein